MSGDKPIADPAKEECVAHHKENFADGNNTHVVAETGFVATDQYGRALVEFDRAAETRLRLKIDFYVVPTVSLIYLFCFIDRANIGMFSALSNQWMY